MAKMPKDMVSRGQASIHSTHELSAPHHGRRERRARVGPLAGGAPGRQAKELGKSIGVDEHLGSSVPFKFFLSANPAEAEASESRIHIHIHIHIYIHYAPATPPQGLMR